MAELKAAVEGAEEIGYSVLALVYSTPGGNVGSVFKLDKPWADGERGCEVDLRAVMGPRINRSAADDYR